MPKMKCFVCGKLFSSEIDAELCKRCAIEYSSEALDNIPDVELSKTGKIEVIAPVKTLRDEFAMAALTGLLASPNYSCIKEEDVKHAYAYSDLMLRQREEK